MKKAAFFIFLLSALFLFSQGVRVSAAEKKSDNKVIAKQEAVYTLRKVRARRRPDSSAKVTEILKKGTKVVLLSENKKGWSKIRYKSRVRYVRSRYLTREKVYLTDKKTGRIIVDPRQNDYEIILVNKKRTLAEGYKPELSEIFDTDIMMEKNAAEAYEQMYRAAERDGAILEPISGYRSYEKQRSLFEKRVAAYMRSSGADRERAEKKVSFATLPPGTSEHNAGVAMDICEVRREFVYTYEYRWLVKNAHKYGFILRYPEDKKNITGISFEPWHWRYVGAEHAGKIKKSGLCLEEYIKAEKMDM